MIGPAPKDGSGAARSATSLPVTTPITPGSASASEVSMRDDAGVRVRAAHDRGVQHPRQLDVVDVAALAAQEARVLDAVDALADPARGPLGAAVSARDVRGGGILLDASCRAPPAAARMDSTICW